MAPPPRFDGSAPLYAQIEQNLLGRIESEWKRGDLLPTQKELAREYGTSLITIKRALDEIARKGHLQSTRGRGTVVVRPQIRDDRGDVSSWTDTMTGLGRQPSTVAIKVSTRVPPRDVARALGVRAREKTVVIERVRSLDDEPICLMRNELPLALVPELPAEGLREESLYGWLKKRWGLQPSRADEEVEARLATAEERQALGPDTSIVMVVRRHTFMAHRRPLEMAEMVAPAHRYRYRVEIVKKSQ
jgi:GntR family transcriptional regulator